MGEIDVCISIEVSVMRRVCIGYYGSITIGYLLSFGGEEIVLYVYRSR